MLLIIYCLKIFVTGNMNLWYQTKQYTLLFQYWLMLINESALKLSQLESLMVVWILQLEGLSTLLELFCSISWQFAWQVVWNHDKMCIRDRPLYAPCYDVIEVIPCRRCPEASTPWRRWQHSSERWQPCLTYWS